MKKRKLVLEDIDVTTFAALPPEAEGKGTVHGFITQASCQASCQDYTCPGISCARYPC